MAGSGTGTVVTTPTSDTDITYTGTNIIKAALRCLGVVAPGETPEPSEITDALEALNMILKQWQGPPSYFLQGLKVWANERASLTLTAANSFTFHSAGGADLAIDPPEEILFAYRRNTDNIDSTLSKMLLSEYEAISNKSAVGTPTKYYYEKELTQGVFFLNYVPADITDTIEITYRRPLEKFSAGSDSFDLPQHWFRAVKWNLALEVGGEYGKDISQVLPLAKESLTIAQSFYPETSVDYFQPGLD